MADELTVISSSKGMDMIQKGGYLYLFDKHGSNKIIWRCTRYQKSKCKVRMYTTGSKSNPKLLQEFQTHNHEPDAIGVEVKVLIGKIKNAATASTTSPANIIAEQLQFASQATQGALPLIQNLKRNIRRAREIQGGSLAIPNRKEDIDLPEAFKVTNRGELFLLHDSGPESDRLLIFSTAENLLFLQKSDTWLADGTFKVCPAIFDELYVIHGIRNSVVFPLVYCLTPKRSEGLYTRILTVLKATNANLNPKIIMTDFETAAINAFRKAFPHAENKGCFFHISQCIFRRIQKSPDVLKLYSSDSDFALKIRYLAAIAFVPPEDVAPTFDLLMENEFFVTHELMLADLTSYFERNWIGSWNRSKTLRMAARYSIELWNCFYSVLQDIPKTNNACEGFHNGFAILIGASNPTIYKFIEGVKAQQTLTDLKMNQYLAGTVAPPNQRYQLTARHLKEVVEKYGIDDFSHLDYLRRIAYCLTI